MYFIWLGVFLIIIASCEEKYGYGAPPKGKLIHDMRHFLNMTIDWSSRLYNKGGKTAIPMCHEERIRQSFFTQPLEPRDSVSRSNGGFTLIAVAFGFQPGYLVFPVVVTVYDGNPLTEGGPLQPRRFYAASVHKFGSPDQLTDEDLYNSVRLAHVSTATWRRIWDQWREATENGSDYCNGGAHFDNLISQINKDDKKDPFTTMIHENYPHYTDITSDACDRIKCACNLKKQRETLTLAYPTQEGLDVIATNARIESEDQSTPNKIRFIRKLSDSNILRPIGDCYIREHRKADGQKPLSSPETPPVHKCVFSKPFC